MMDLGIAREFLKGSELALDNELCRPAVANAYYAMFWAARAALRHVGVTRSEWSHGAIQHAVGLELIKKRQLLASHSGKRFSDAYRLRCDAHYEIAGVNLKQTQRILRDAAAFVAGLEKVIEE